jgi:hypothetical protein
MSDWIYAQSNPADELAQLHYFSMKKRQDGRDIEFVITVREFAERNKQMMRFFAQADKQTNQKSAPYVPCGWGETMLVALGECIKAIHRFPYEGD